MNLEIRDNGTWLPPYKPVLAKDIYLIIENAPIPSVYYFDRVNRAAIELAKYFKNKGSLIYFEPSSLNNSKQFEECLDLAHIIKFSNERIRNYASSYPKQRVSLEIETLGRDGLRYRFSHNLDSVEWNTISSYKISSVVDSAGSGDWFSAGIISKIASKGINRFDSCTEKDILVAMKFGQSLGALNCFFDGARGLMYELSRIQLMDLIKKVQSNEAPFTIVNKKNDVKPNANFSISSLY